MEVYYQWHPAYIPETNYVIRCRIHIILCVTQFNNLANSFVNEVSGMLVQLSKIDKENNGL